MLKIENVHILNHKKNANTIKLINRVPINNYANYVNIDYI